MRIEMTSTVAFMALAFLCIIQTACATAAMEGAFPKVLMHKKVNTVWLRFVTDKTCPPPEMYHANDTLPVNLDTRLIGRTADGSEIPIESATVWLRESRRDEVQRVQFDGPTGTLCRWIDEVDDPECKELDHGEPGVVSIPLRLSISTLAACENGHIVEDSTLYPHVVLVQAAGCRERLIVVTDQATASQRIELRCQTDKSHNYGVQPSAARTALVDRAPAWRRRG